ncbi:hypothetical protein CQW23_30709 [Capsicum baccatum]|uniref:DUF1985 domain-containing protein n=1 Tax=Capsicum baccatum TaxID=33114 RepID=A0A2G2V9P4_CAPBA|nr:hypothetical protein CQW23_30709 [Capsicum baccatum]
MKIKKKVNIDMKLAGKGIRYDPNFVVSDVDFEDFTNCDIQLKDLKNVHATSSRITRSQGKSKVTKLYLEECSMDKKWRCDEDVLQISILFFIHSFLFPITYGDVITKNNFLLVESGNYEIFPWEKLCFRLMLELMKSKVYQQKTMYRCVGFPLAFQCWFYECCPYVNGHLADRVGDGVPCILNWFVKDRPTYKEVKSVFFYIRQEQVVLRNITPTILEKIILQLPYFKPVDAIVHSVDLPSTSKQDCSNSSTNNELSLLRISGKGFLDREVYESSFELIFRALYIKNEPKVGTTIGDNNGDNSIEKDDETPNVGDAEISKFTQPDKSVAITDATDLVCDNVRKVDATASDHIKGIEENMVVASVMLGETPAIPR